ncbi:MAG: ketoacyl-ACP synthase III [Gemmatimonadetes bacterium]|jgi:3-oxoacyl-[acyl-carrier-protein] synthase-3|nr:ketoacyl-ACP synthase III [Gemmatimonadota bacterium]
MLAATGHAVPKRILTNAEFPAMGIDTSDEWIRERTGIGQRHIAGEGETLTSISTEAARLAMQRAGVTASELDCIILGTASPDRLLPSTAVEVQAALGATRAVAFDLDAACSGWLYSIQVAEGLIATGAYETILVIGGEVLSRIINWKDRNTCVLFGDGAGATIIKRSTKGRGILSAYMRSDGTLADLLHRPKGAGAAPITPEIILEGSHWIQMAGREVFKNAVRSMADASDRALDGAKLSAGDIDLMIPHQANIRIIEATAKHAGISMDKVYVNVDRFGNTSAASIPIALSEAQEKGLIKDGSTVMFVAFGAGFTWGSMVVRF